MLETQAEKSYNNDMDSYGLDLQMADPLGRELSSFFQLPFYEEYLQIQKDTFFLPDQHDLFLKINDNVSLVLFLNCSKVNDEEFRDAAINLKVKLEELEKILLNEITKAYTK